MLPGTSAAKQTITKTTTTTTAEPATRNHVSSTIVAISLVFNIITNFVLIIYPFQKPLYQMCLFLSN